MLISSIHILSTGFDFNESNPSFSFSISSSKALEHLKAVAILDKSDSLNAAGGALFEDVVSSMYTKNVNIPTVNYVYGIGGRDTKADDIESVYKDLEEIAETGEIENPYRYLGLRREAK